MGRCPSSAIIGIHFPCEQFATSTTRHRQELPDLTGDSWLQPTEEELANRIFGVVSGIRGRATDEDVLDFLLQDQACCGIQPSKDFIDNLLQRFSDDWKSALAIFRWAGSQKSYRHSPEACGKMVDILGKARQIERMLAFLHEMRSGGLVTLNTVAKVMRRLTASGRLTDAIKIFDDLGSFGIQKDVESMNLLLGSLCKEKRVELARGVFLELKACIAPNANTFNIFIGGWCAVSRMDEAHWTLEEMKGYGLRPSVISYSTIIQAYCNHFNFRKVNDLLDEMKKEGCQPNVVTYTTVMHAHAKSQETEAALQIFERTKAEGCKLDVVFYNSLISMLGKAGDLSRAFHVFNVEMRESGIPANVSTYNTLISIFCFHSQEQKALDVLREMENSGSCKPDLLTYHPLLKLCFRTGKTGDNLRKLLTDMANKHNLCLDLGTYSLLIHGLCRAGKCEWAYLLFEEMTLREITPRTGKDDDTILEGEGMGDMNILIKSV
ncbi:hypothetical protein ACLOJK_012059 [Asimina triloba]